jgi:fructose-bisphosphate aldolase, class II
MAMISLRQLLDHAAEQGYGVPAFNINNMEQIIAITQAAEETDSPVILQASAGARKYAGVPHGRGGRGDLAPCPDRSASRPWRKPRGMPGVDPVGFTSVMMDGSLEEDMKTPASYDYNVAVTAKVVEMAHAVGVSVEGELGCLGSLESGTAGEEDGSGAEGILSHDQLLTDRSRPPTSWRRLASTRP